MGDISKNREIERVKLDLKDRKILYELDFHARDSYNQLAKKVGLSKQGVEYRINNLIKRGVIKGFYPVINVPKLGFIYLRVLLTLQNASEVEKNKIIEHLKKDKRVFWLFEMQGTFDLLVVVWSKTIDGLRTFVEELEMKYGNFIKKRVESIMTNVIHYRYRFLTDSKKIEEIHMKETEKRVEIDKKDELILNILSRNPRVSLVEMSKSVKESPKTIAYRIAKLEKEKLIEAYRPIINHNLLGLTYYKIFINLNKVSEEQSLKLKQHIISNPQVIYLVEGISMQGDLDIEMMVNSNQELFDFIKDLRNKFPKLIAEYSTLVFIDTLKVKYLPF